MKKAIRITFLGTLDGAMGAILGGLTMLFSLSIIFWLISHLSIKLPENWLKDAHLYTFTKEFGPNLVSKVLNIIPFGDNWIEKIEEIKGKIL